MPHINKIEKKIHDAVSSDIKVEVKNNCVVLSGRVTNWDDAVLAGSLAVSKKYYGVVNNIELEGFSEKIYVPKTVDNAYDGDSPDVLIIGAGICGCAIARELSKYNIDTVLLEKNYDVALGASSRNDGDVHVGIDLHVKQAKHRYNNRGNALYDKLCEELGIVLHRTGHTIVFYKNWENLFVYPLIKLKSLILGIKGVRFVKGEALKAVEKGVPSWAKGAVFMPTGAEVSPYKLTVALAENAVANGVRLHLNTMVKGITVSDGKIISVQTNRGTIYPKLVINASGVFSDVIADMAGDRTFTIHPRKGTNLILDKKCDYATTSMQKSPFSKFESDKKKVDDLKHHTKGGGVVHTVDYNTLLGPTAKETPYREDNTTSKNDIDGIIDKLKRVAEKLSYADVITYFSGTRAATYEEDFVVRKGIFTENIIEVAGIQSPGLTAAPAIAEDVAAWTEELLGKLPKNEEYNPIRKAPPHLAEMTKEERAKLIKKNPDYGEIVCRCEEISKGEILDALNSPIKVYTVDAIKRRVRPGMGRCQGGFCSPLVMKILAEAQGTHLESTRKADVDSLIVYGDTKGGCNEENV